MAATLTEAEIAEFQALYKKHFGIELTSAMALDKGYRLAKLVEVVLKNSADMPPSEDGDSNIPPEDPGTV